MARADLAALVLAGGRGRRLQLGDGLPKHLRPVGTGTGRRPLIDHVLAALPPGVGAVFAAVPAGPTPLRDHLSGRWPSVAQLAVADPGDLRGSVDGCLAALDARRALVLEGDRLLAPCHLRRFAEWAAAGPGDSPLALLVGPVPAATAGARVDVGPDGHVAAIGHARPGHDAVRHSVAAVWVSPARLAGRMATLGRSGGPAEPGFGLWHHVARSLLAAGEPVLARLAPEPGVNVNRPADLAAAERYWRDAIGAPACRR